MTHLNYPKFDQFDDMFKGADKFLVGYDRVFDQLSQARDQAALNLPNFPPYNIRKTDENTYVIEMAVAGFDESEIEITLKDDKLVIDGRSNKSNDDVIYSGLALRDFCHWFTVDDQVVVKNAEMFNGLLNIWLERIIPETKKPKKIQINSGDGNDNREYLTE